MCGIAGLYSIANDASELATRVDKMVAAMHHRGPDDGGREIVARTEGRDGASVVLGHRRLSIIDLSPAGHQPMVDPESGLWITFNGEIYNFRELRRELIGLGARFRTDTDTEVILQAWRMWGSACVRRLRGIFAFATWDATTRRLTLARDHLGVKPLYYWSDGRTLAFASEVRALLACGLVPRRLDARGLRSMLAFGSVQEPYTLVDGIRSVPPAYVLTCGDGRIEEQRYWSLPRPDERDGARVPLELVEETLTEATALQLMSDVPLGAFLSGGIDSTAVVALMQRSSNRPVRTFCVVFDDVAYDERAFARSAARHIGTDHTELELTGTRVRDSLPAALAAIDQPSVDGLNTYFVSHITKEAGLTVALSGVGGDELFGGYNGFQRALSAEQWTRRLMVLPTAVRHPLADAVHRWAPSERWRKGADLLVPAHAPYFLTRQLFGDRQAASLLEPSLMINDWAPRRMAELEADTAGMHPVNRASALEMQTYMVSTLLRDTDQMSMAHGLEVRVPLLDHVLVERVFRLAGSSKLHPSQPKPLLTLALGSAMPEECVHRRKRGFELPFARWLRGALKDRIRHRLVDEPSALPLRRAAVAQVVRDFEAGRLPWSRVWALYALAEWLDAHGLAA